jgi:hypothetical protein
MKGKVDEAMSMFFRKGDKFGEHKKAVRQPAATASNREQFWFFRECHRRKLSTVSGGKTNLSLAADQTGST